MSHFETTIYYDQTDLSGAVYHPNYLTLFSRGRELHLGLEKMRELCDAGIFFVVHKLNVRYRKPAHFGDRVTIATEGTQERPPRLCFVQRALRDNELLVEAEVEIAVVNAQGRPIRAFSSGRRDPGLCTPSGDLSI